MSRVHQALVALYLLLTVWTGAVLLSHDPPFIDYPQHVWNLAVLREPAAWADVFRVQLDPLGTNSPWFVIDRLLAPFLTPNQSMALGFTLAIAGLPLVTGLWAREIGRDGWLAMVLCWSVAWSGMIYWGFLHYCLAVVVGFAILTVDRRHQRDGAGVIPLGVLWTVLFLLHTIAWAWTLVLVLVQRAAFHVRGGEAVHWDRVGGGLLATVPGGLLAIRWVVGTLMAPSELGTLGRPGEGLGLKFNTPLEVLDLFVTEMNASIRWSWVDDVVGGGLLIAALIGLIWTLWKQPGERRTAAVVLAVGLTTTLAVFVFPSHMRGQFFLSTRLIAYVPVCAAALAAPKLGERARVWLLGLAAVVAVGVQAVQHRTVLAWEEEIAPPMRLMTENVPDGATTMIWPAPPYSKVVLGQIYGHLPSLHASRTHGRNAFSFAVFEPNPVVHRDLTGEQQVMPGEEYRPWCTAFRGAAADTTHVIVRGQKQGQHCGAPLHYQRYLEELGREDEWTLYRVRSPLPPRNVRCFCEE